MFKVQFSHYVLLAPTTGDYSAYHISSSHVLAKEAKV